MNRLLMVGFVCMCALLSHCSAKQEDPKPQGVLTDAQEKALKQAKEVEGVLKKANEDRMKDVDQPDSK